MIYLNSPIYPYLKLYDSSLIFDLSHDPEFIPVILSFNFNSFLVIVTIVNMIII